ncbi:hypothetical protein [Streptomyces uncialis]|uniref:hypothetical protein n=1 Tax=Streptomyces uncialis TaxID=1048205 RepID=UPI0022503FF9|nr:hypothetical protein [Streptomyces uncialis]MCX4659202.1 hypothetical protein [Streptomyces uncialis]
MVGPPHHAAPSRPRGGAVEPEGTTIDPITQPDDHLARLDRFLRQAAAIMHAFERDPAQQQDGDGRPTDGEAFGWAAHRRDRTLWEAFRPVREHANAMLATAAAQLNQIPGAYRGAWESRITALSHAAESQATEHDRAIDRLRNHLVKGDSGVAAVDCILTEFYDEAWPALGTWAVGASAVTELDAAVSPRAAAERKRSSLRPAARGSSSGAVETALAPGPTPARRQGHR